MPLCAIVIYFPPYCIPLYKMLPEDFGSLSIHVNDKGRVQLVGIKNQPGVSDSIMCISSLDSLTPVRNIFGEVRDRLGFYDKPGSAVRGPGVASDRDFALRKGENAARSIGAIIGPESCAIYNPFLGVFRWN